MQVKIDRALVSKGLVQTLLVIEAYVLVQPSAQGFWAFIFVQVDIFILQSPKESLDENVVQCSSLSVHGYFDFFGFQEFDIILVRKLTALIGLLRWKARFKQFRIH